MRARMKQTMELSVEAHSRPNEWIVHGIDLNHGNGTPSPPNIMMKWRVQNLFVLPLFSFIRAYCSWWSQHLKLRMNDSVNRISIFAPYFLFNANFRLAYKICVCKTLAFSLSAALIHLRILVLHFSHSHTYLSKPITHFTSVLIKSHSH